MKLIDDFPREAGKYPYKRPRTHYLMVDDGKGYVLDVFPGQGATGFMEPVTEKFRGLTGVNDVLISQGSEPIEEKRPFVAYGANAHAYTLRKKFHKENLPATLVTFKGKTSGFDVVHGAYIPKAGSIPAQIAHSEDTEVEVWLNLLDDNQIARMHDSESLRDGNYFLGLMPFTFEDGLTIMAYGYFGGIKPTFIDHESGERVAFASSDYKGQDGSLEADVDFTPIDAENRVFVERAQKEVRELFSREVKEKLNFDLYDARGEIPEDVKSSQKLTLASDFIGEKFGRFFTHNVEMVEDPYVVESLKSLKDLV